MAGSYPDAPGNRLAWHLDGTLALTSDGTGIYQWDANQTAAVNDESTSAATPSTLYMSLFFPRLMDISGFFGSFSGYNTGNPYNFVYSTDATTPLDGTWVSWPSQPSFGNGYRSAAGQGSFGYGYVAVASPYYRSEIKTLSLSGVKAIRWNQSYGGYGNWYQISTIHVYGRPASGANTDRLEIWHPTLDQRVGGAFFDWGNVARTGTVIKQFRVKNLSDTLTANNISVQSYASTDSAPSFTGMHTFSTGGSYTASANVGTLNAQQISNVISVRLTVPSNASLGPWASRISAEASSWS